MADPIGHQVISWLKIRNINLSDNTVNCMGCFFIKSPHSCLTLESPLKVMKNAFYFMLKAPFVLEIFIFLS